MGVIYLHGTIIPPIDMSSGKAEAVLAADEQAVVLGRKVKLSVDLIVARMR